MNTMLSTVLLAEGPHPSLGEHADTYGRVIGSWSGQMHNHMLPGSKPASIEVHLGWALEGRAVQDVWITPARPDRAAAYATSGGPFDWFGTTLRIFDPAAQCWRARWWNPISQLYVEIEGRRQGDDIVQIGTRDGRPIRWTFSEIRPESLRWQAHILEPDGASWRLEVDIALRRIGRR